METNNIPGPQNTPSQSPKKPFWAILIVLVLLAAGGWAIYYWQANQEKEGPKITGLEVAKKTASFLDKSFQPDGSVLGGFLCTKGTDACESYGVDPDLPHYGQAIYSLALLSKEANDPSIKVKADKALDYVIDRCATNALMCEWNFYPLAQYYQETKDQKYLNAMLVPAEKFLTMSSEDLIQSNTGHKIASLYLATGDERFKNRLLEVAEEELKKPITNPNYMFQVVWSIYLQAYYLTEDNKYLQASENFYNTVKLEAWLTDDEFKDWNNVAYLIKGAEGLIELSQISEYRETYRFEAKRILQMIMDRLWDTPENLKANGDYGFVAVDTPAEKVDKYTIGNGWLIKLFVLMGEENFNQPITK